MGSERDVDTAAEHDPFAPVAASPRGARTLAVLGGLLGVVAVFSGLAALAGPVGMALGLIGHLKGSRLGLPATALAAVGMVAGFALTFLLR